ncbi:hypothetical protein SI65_00913 [Aspergillus cristatus]|uniref:GPI-anchored cell surface glycoprotein n=1 Tax=Aspergillus cristatus TaxID=573508 RepID=A0A1E3BQR8_ASPCR|nr:hypothetical protein SI65_00913 [Aspergillus cristatus]
MSQTSQSQSLPTTPLTTTFEKPLPGKRRRTQQSVDGDDKASQISQDVPQTPNQNDSFSAPQVTTSGFVAINHARNHRPDSPNGDTAETATPASNGKRNSQSAKQSNLHAFLENGRHFVTETEVTESKKDKPNKAPALETSVTEGNRKTRKSIPAKLKEAGGVENTPDQTQITTPRPERKSKNAATEANAKISKMSARGPRQKNAEKALKEQNNATSATPLPPSSTRRERKSARKNQETAANSTNATPLRSMTRRRGAPREVNGTREPEVPDNALHSPDSTQSDNDTEVYVDGQTDGQASPKSSATARISRRNRKPTMRAMESFESEKRYRRKRGASARADSQSGELNGTVHPDLALVAQRLFELAVEAVSPSFKPTPDAKTQLAQLRKEYYAKKEQQNAPPTSTRKGKATAAATPATAATSKPGVTKKSKQISQPWTDEKGWKHTGFVNEHGEEYLLVPSDSEVYRPNNTYGDSKLPLPPIRLKSREQLDKDRIFGFPPRIGERNVPRNSQFTFYYEDVDEVRERILAREEARRIGIPVDRSMQAADIRAKIAQHPSKPEIPKETPKPVEKVRRRRRTQVPPNEEGSDYQPKQRRRRRATAPGTSAQASALESPDKKSMKIKLKFGKGIAAAIDTGNNGTNAEPPKRPRQEIDDDPNLEPPSTGLPPPHQMHNEHKPLDHDTPSPPRKRNLSATEDNPDEAHPAKKQKLSESEAATADDDQATGQGANDTPGRRPRRRATGNWWEFAGI